MINLLPDETKRQLRAAHANTALVKYVMFLGLAIAFLVIACGGTYLLLVNDKAINEKLAQTSNNGSSSTSSVQSQADKLQADLVTSKAIINQQLLYSDIITGIGAAMPAGAVIDGISLSDTILNSPITVQVRATSSNIEPTMKANFQRSSLFSSYSLVSTMPNAGDASGYGTLMTISLTINKGAAK